MSAVLNPGVPSGEFVVETVAGIQFLFIRLPSGRRLAYPHPQIEPDPQWGHQITYWGQLPGTVVWGRVKLYGGKIAENIVQAIAADVMSYGARSAEARWMLPFALIHDQGLALAMAGQTAAAFAAALGSLPPWAVGLPLKVDAHVAPYYSK
jgi:DNA polymerase